MWRYANHTVSHALTSGKISGQIVQLRAAREWPNRPIGGSQSGPTGCCLQSRRRIHNTSARVGAAVLSDAQRSVSGERGLGATLTGHNNIVDASSCTRIATPLAGRGASCRVPHQSPAAERPSGRSAPRSRNAWGGDGTRPARSVRPSGPIRSCRRSTT